MSSHRPQRKWGQNFLRNPSAVDKIVAAIEPAAGELIIEVGPGEGALTSRLALLPNRVRAFEIDPALAARLARTFQGTSVTVEHADALEIDLPEEPFRAVGNLPYNAGTPILRRLIASPYCRRAVFMLQKEVADRIVAPPGHADYGFLTLFVRLYAEPSIVMTLGPGSFYPRPKVRSSVVALDQIDPGLENAREQLLALISTSFRMRRKTLVNNLLGFLDLTRESAAESVRKASLPGDIRAEQLSLDDFDRLATAIGLRASGDQAPAQRLRHSRPPSARR